MIELPSFDALALSLHHSPGVQAVLVGSGLSRAAGIPTGWEITLDLIRRLGALDGVTDHDDWAAWYRAKYSKEPSYSEILDTLATTPAERRSILHRYIDPQEGDEDSRRPTKAHHALAKLVVAGAVKVIITTNFDRLIENALRDAGIEPTVIASDDAIAGATPLVHAKCTLIKVHGDYLDSRIKNTDTELESYSPAMNALLDEIFDKFGLLVVGWSGDWDAALRSAMVRAPTRRYSLYWAARGNLSGLAQDLLDQRGGRSITITDADSFFQRLDNTLDALKQTSRPHPQSVAVAIALAKKYCRDDRFAMEWAEFLHSEVMKIRSYVNGPEYPVATPTTETFNGIVNAFVARTEILRRACLICGRWGTPSAIQSANRAIRSLSFAENPRGGFTCYNSLREFPASICFYWIIGGLIDSDNWQQVQLTFRQELKLSYITSNYVGALPFQYYENVEWKLLAGLEKRLAPISDFLAKNFVIDSSDVSLSDAQADDLFDQIELQISFEFAHQQLISKERFWFPVGRFRWKNRGVILENALAKVEGFAESDPYLKAGMLGGSQASAANTTKKIREYANELSRYVY